MGKGTLVSELVRRDPALSLSRSWTTRPRRPGEPDDAYRFVDRDTFEQLIAEGGFLEWNEFEANGHLYGTPLPDAGGDHGGGGDVVLEIDLNGARQVREKVPDAVVILVLPPSREELARRLRHRGDDEAQAARRLALAEHEMAEGRHLADHEVVNDDLARAVDEVAGILDRYRRTRPTGRATGDAEGDD